MKNAFTLAEVLVTVGIIGVVAAMTVPNLMENYQRQSYITQLRKVYSEFSQAAESAMADSNTQRLREARAIRNNSFLQNYFKTTQTCSADTISDCFADTYTTINGGALRLRDYISGNSSCAVVASGYSVCLSNDNVITVDVNGKQGPNVMGRDLFLMRYEDNGSISSAYSSSGEPSADDCVDGDYSSCFAKILNDGWVMDY